MKKRGGGGTEAQKEKRQAQMVVAHQQYMDVAQKYLDRARASLDNLQRLVELTPVQMLTIIEIHQYMADADRQIDQTT